MKCLKCCEVIPPRHVQQGGCHMGCYSDYINEELKVWKVCYQGTCYIHEESAIDLSTLHDGETAQVAKVKRIELMNMKEFQGF